MICTVNETYILNEVIHMEITNFEIIFSYTNEMISVLTKGLSYGRLYWWIRIKNNVPEISDVTLTFKRQHMSKYKLHKTNFWTLDGARVFTIEILLRCLRKLKKSNKTKFYMIRWLMVFYMFKMNKPRIFKRETKTKWKVNKQNLTYIGMVIKLVVFLRKNNRYS